jgi:hypothetical protein
MIEIIKIEEFNGINLSELLICPGSEYILNDQGKI